MKKFLSRLLVVFILTATVSSCTKDEGAQASIVGKWTVVQTQITVPGFPPITEPYDGNVAGCNKNYVEFVAGGTVNDVEYSKVNNVCAPNVEVGTWAQNGNNLTIGYGTDVTTATIVSATPTELKFSITITEMGVTATSVVTFAKI